MTLKHILLATGLFVSGIATAQNPSDGCTGVPALSVGSSCSTISYTLPGSYTNGALLTASCFASGNDRDDGWYSVTAPSTGTMTVSLDGDQGHTLAIFTTCGGGTELACDQQASGTTATVSFSATSGVTYYVQVHRNQGNNTANMAGTICAYMGAAAGSGVDCANANPLTPGTQQCGTNSNVGSFPDGGTSPTNPCNSSYNDGEYWYSFTGTGDALQLDVSGLTATYSGLFVLDDCPSNTPNCIASYTSGSSTSNFTLTTPSLTLGQTYYIVMANWSSPYQTDFCIDATLTTPPPTPANDDCSGAYTLTVNPDNNCTSVTSGTVLNATGSTQATGGCFGTDDDDVWFQFTATNSTHYVSLLNVAGSVTDMYHSVWEGTCPSLTLVSGTCSDGNSQTVTGLTPGNTYFVRVYTYTSTGGQNSTFDVCIGTPPPPPSNDECANAISLTVNSDAICTSVTSGYTVGATQSMAGCAGTANDDVWFSFVALDANQDIQLSNATGTTDLVHELFDGSCGSLTSLGCSDPDLSSYTGLTPGNTYYVRVYTYSSTGSNTGFDICITSPCGISGTPPSCGLAYTYSTTSYNPANYNTGTDLTFSDDRFADTYTDIGFDFCFDGVTYSQCLVSSNGYIIFPGCYSAAPTATTVAPSGTSAWDITADAPNTTNAPRNAILGPWQDIDPSVSGTIRYNTEGTAPNRVFIVKFDDIAMFSSSCNSLLFAGQIMLYETTNNIEIHIGEKTTCSTWNEEGAIMGLTAYDGTTAIIPSGYNYSTPWTVATNSPEGHLFENNCPDCNVVLPVELSTFDAFATEETNILHWTTESEKNNDYFVVERSSTGKEFTALATIDGVGTTTETTHYSYEHSDPEAVEIYRLRQVDLDGSISYSKSISVHRNETLISVYPNPSEGQLFLDYSGMKGQLTIRYTDVVGHVLEEAISVQGNAEKRELQGFARLDAGMYMVQVVDAFGNVLHQAQVLRK